MGLEVTFIDGDVTTLCRDDLFLEGDQGFDVITCAAALVLLDYPLGKLRHWAFILSPTGKMIFDVPTEQSLIVGRLSERLIHEKEL